ncbi:SDR family NAD(P)-dependent oxidoreductase [Desertihabitans aurantiacus]|uniref:SDR family NAD(P)-dependent oxidoreductase n=1 Tax=Desertihabitans aurantiacus TaxID=2282477 RepID=UPI0022B80416|nr:SDR family oxidoreductase [Desertihabitans aurantiacus]
MLTCRAAAPRLQEAHGSIVLLGSAATTSGSPGTYVHYAAAKAGVATLTVGLSKELAPSGVRVNCVEPGTIWTDFHLDPDRPTKVASSIPLGRAGQPEEIAGAVAWLLSDDASYTTGTVLRVAGGL